jgi:DNA-directed RNA polymerase specialized sigma subunit
LFETVFAVVSRLSVKQDKAHELTCPKCRSKAKLHGEGHITYELYVQRNEETEEISKNVSLNVLELTQRVQFHDYPDVLTAKHISKILGISQSATYGIMDQKGAREGF